MTFKKIDGLKPEYHRLCARFVEALALHMTKTSQEKYPDLFGNPNWKMNCPKNPEQLLDAAYRHLNALYKHEVFDEEFHTPHEVSAAVNLMMYFYHTRNK
jgi:Domain of unknown function (DUF5664)